MILAFKTHWKNGSPTYFIPKIYHSLDIHSPFKVYPASYYHHKYLNDYTTKFDNVREVWGHSYSLNELTPKLHTIRKGSRWKEGMKIHFAINNRSKDYFQFAPVLEVVSVQDIEIIHESGTVEILIDGEHFGETFLDKSFLGDIETLAKNDGFDCLDDFAEFFFPNKQDGYFKGQIIHWSNLRY